MIRLQVELVDLLLLRVCILLGTSSSNADFVVEGFTTTDGVLQAIDFTYEQNMVSAVRKTWRRTSLLTLGNLSGLFRLFSCSVGCLGINTGSELLVADDGDAGLGVGHCRYVCGCVVGL